MLTICLRKAEENYYKELINNESQNLFKIWKIFGYIINPKKARNKITFTN